ncbi:triose/dihydroxyacetone kinase / FAD-AMP lyase (cyclizing) [Geosmithia morbida]|uniref:Triose/dihydroxyacetone kinase / FAD-AMP lyase (Cyclizing) n=1 Tax=Geosmithia morbida TaxID=1094350 RepID=A0A9P4YRM5_9HYPO|nr:triose/dihydroxyacetone kinase / FAD-AMP lyase (cyclizing) [Geosmithia morbida]KAF4120448.1 triose/dihydroxyacetone kinase / FAD-AMP lyase (cyclizing) [Geosmithia morbida]
MSTKHFINDPAKLVSSALESLSLVNPHVAFDPINKVVYQRPSSSSSPQKVALVAGGGAGHEPSFAGMVGPGMLNAAVSGTIFASPSTEQVHAAMAGRLDPAKSSDGVLVVVMNYTGDVLNFGMAVEKARASGRVRGVEMVVVGDDVGVGRARAGKVGRRGIAGTVLVVKVAGALAARGYRLDQVARVARLTADNLVSVGASLEHVHVPGRSAADADAEDALGTDEAEIGMGIHNEPGCARVRVELPELVAGMLRQMLDRDDEDRAFVPVSSNEVVLLVNNLGGVSPLELGAVTAEVASQLRRDHGIRPVRVLSGTYMTSLNGLGFSITLLNVVNTDIGGPSMVDLLDDPSEATGWAAPVAKTSWEARSTAELTDDVSGSHEVGASGLELVGDPAAAQAALVRGLDAVVAAEPDVTRYDTVVGDGDCGIGLKRGAQSVLEHVASRPLTADPVVDLASIVPVVERSMDGTSGALYSIFLNALVGALAGSPAGPAEPRVWAAALRRSCDALSRYTPARPGDRTLVDALHPFVDELERSGDLAEAAKAAKDAADATKGMEASLGRSVYVGGDGFTKVPDPGAHGLACFFLGLAGL